MSEWNFMFKNLTSTVEVLNLYIRMKWPLSMRKAIIMSGLPKGRSFLQAQGHMLQFCRRQVFHRKLGKQDCKFTRDWIGVVASHYFPQPTLSLASEQTLKDPGEAPTWRWGEWIWLTGPSGLHRNSSQWLNICFIRVFDQIRDPEIPIILCPHHISLSFKQRKKCVCFKTAWPKCKLLGRL